MIVPEHPDDDAVEAAQFRHGVVRVEVPGTILPAILREFQIKRIGTQFNLVVPFDLAMIANADLLENPVVIPNAKHAFTDKSRQIDFATRSIREFEIKMIFRPRFNMDLA